MKTIIQPILSTLVLIAISGCSTPQSVKSLSAEQLKLQQTTQTSFEEYFAIVEKLVENFVNASCAEEDLDLKNEVAIYRKKHVADAAKPGADLDSLSSDLAKKIQDATKQSNDRKVEYRNRLDIIRTKHKEMIQVLTYLSNGQSTLNSYIQIKKTDEAIASFIYSKLGVSEETVKNYATSISETLQIR